MSSRASDESDEIVALMEEIERAWYERRDYATVDRLAATHPKLSKALYEFFADVVTARDGQGRRQPELAKESKRAREWLEREGFALAAAAKAEEAKTATVTSGFTENTGVVGTAESTGKNAPSFFVQLKILTGERQAKVLAKELGISPDFLVLVSEHPDMLPPKARNELAQRAKVARGIEPFAIMPSLEAASTPVQKAASRSTSYSGEGMTYRDLVHRSTMDENQKKFWLALA